MSKPEWTEVLTRCDAVVRQLERLVQRVETLATLEAGDRRVNREQRSP